MLAVLPAIKVSLSPRPRYSYFSQVSNLTNFGPPLLLSPMNSRPTPTTTLPCLVLRGNFH